MNNSLSVQAAKQLIEFISTTNYELAPHGDGLFSSMSEAVAHVDSAEYNSEEPLNVCFDTKQGNYWESAQVSFDGSKWFIEDHGMGGQSSKGKNIQEAIEAFRLEHDSTCDYYPVELMLTKELTKCDALIVSENKDFKASSDMQSVGELWQSVATIAQSRVKDNNLSSTYPLSVREMQVASLKNLVMALEASHKIMQENND